MTKKKNMVIVAFCGVQGCCPTVEIKGEDILVKDDFGNVAKMSKAQWISLAQQTVSKI